jgi:hypothetical protein
MRLVIYGSRNEIQRITILSSELVIMTVKL